MEGTPRPQSLGLAVRGIAIVVMTACIVMAACGESARSSSATGSDAYTHHQCVKVHNRNQYNGTDLRTGAFSPDVNPNRCTDILWEDGKRIFNTPPSQVLKLKKY